MKNLKSFINNEFKDFPKTNEIKNLKEELFESLKNKYETLINEGKTEQEAYINAIDQFGDIDELKKEFGVNKSIKKKSNIFKLFIYASLAILITMFTILKESQEPLVDKPDIVYFSIFTFYIIYSLFITKYLFKQNRIEWYWITIIFGILVCFYKSIAHDEVFINLGILFIIIGVAYGIYKNRFTKSKDNIINTVISLTFFTALNFNIYNILLINHYFYRSFLMVIETTLYMFTFFLNLYVFLKYMKTNHLNYQKDKYIVILMISMNVLTSIFCYFTIIYYSLLPVLVNLFILKQISKKEVTNIIFWDIFNKKSVIRLSTLLIFVLFIVTLHLKSTYLFMPFEIKGNILSWRDFQNPVYVEIIKDNNDYEKRERYYIDNYHEVKQLIKKMELKSYYSSHLINQKVNDEDNYQITIIGRPRSTYIHFSEHDDFAVHESYYAFPITEEFKQYIDTL
ncbi:MAG: hypothetical protein K0Q49_2595 [Haloplasmataceae bacterium]|nr:hypothetical protein [Haloplasmataceae bacterium]